jgi:hypothetical protein
MDEFTQLDGTSERSRIIIVLRTALLMRRGLDADSHLHLQVLSKWSVHAIGGNALHVIFWSLAFQVQIQVDDSTC